MDTINDLLDEYLVGDDAVVPDSNAERKGPHVEDPRAEPSVPFSNLPPPQEQTNPALQNHLKVEKWLLTISDALPVYAHLNPPQGQFNGLDEALFELVENRVPAVRPELPDDPQSAPQVSNSSIFVQDRVFEDNADADPDRATAEIASDLPPLFPNEADDTMSWNPNDENDGRGPKSPPNPFVSMQGVMHNPGQGEAFQYQPVMPRPPEKTWPAIPTDANFDLFSDPMVPPRPTVSPERPLPFTFNAHVGSSKNTAGNLPGDVSAMNSRLAGPVTMAAPPFGRGNPHPTWMISQAERDNVERQIGHSNPQWANNRAPVGQAEFFANNSDVQPAQPGDPTAGITSGMWLGGYQDSDQAPTASSTRAITITSESDAGIAKDKKRKGSDKRGESPAKKTKKKYNDKDSTDNFPAEVFIFDEENHDSVNTAPFEYIKNVLVPIKSGRKPNDIIDFAIEACGGEEALGNAPEDIENKEKKIVGNVAIYDSDNEWFTASNDMMVTYHAKRESEGLGEEFGAAGQLVDIKVLLWRRKQAPKARKAKLRQVPDKEDGLVV